jgi:pimeloyl-ACP methyl ester carboxylesterase
MSQIKTHNVLVKEHDGKPVYINTSICGSRDKPILVLVHGYASSGPLYFKAIKKLTEYFCVVLMDMIGMGGSSRPDDYPYKTITP